MSVSSRIRTVWWASAYVMLIQVCVLCLFVWLIEDEWHFCGRVFYVSWPSIWLAQIGLSHTWLVSALVVPAFMGFCIYGTIRWRANWPQWKRALVLNLAASSAYLIAGWLALDFYPNPLPVQTPFDSNPTERRVYLERYATGYQVGKMGWWREYGLSSTYSVKDAGHYDGINAGGKAFLRMLGTEQQPDWLPKTLLEKGSAVFDDTTAFLGLMWRCRPKFLGGQP
jgi:hypothetical protein